MTLGDLANLASIVGAVDVVVLLFHVAHQIRQNTNAVRSATAQAVHENYASWYHLLAGDSELSQITVNGLQDDAALSEGAFRGGRSLEASAHVFSDRPGRTTMTVSACSNCGGNNLFRSPLVGAGGGYAPNYLPGLGGFWKAESFQLVLCQDCGLTRFFARREATEKVAESDNWERL